MVTGLMYAKLKPQNLIDWGSESAIDPINTLVYIQARNPHLEVGVDWNKSYTM
jgi:hypothetical protein